MGCPSVTGHSVAVVAVASPLHDRVAVSRLLEDVRRSVERVDLTFRGLATTVDGVRRAVQGYPVSVLFVVTGGSEHLVVEATRFTRVPILVYHGEMNSLPAALEAASWMHSRGLQVKLVGLQWFYSHLETIAAGLSAASRLLSGVRVGVVGGIAPWLVYSRCERSTLERVGVEIVEIELSELLDCYEKSSSGEAEWVASKVLSGAERVEVEPSEVVRAARLYLALKGIVERYNLDAVTLDCFKVLEAVGATCCLALSLLNSEGVTAACEGDLPAALAMAVGYYATGKPGFMANTNLVEEGRLVVSHCSIPIAMVDGYSLTTHYESGKSVAVKGWLEPGKPCTLLRVSADLRRARILRCRVRSLSSLRGLCRSQLDLEAPGSMRLLEEPMGNHVVVLPGDHVDKLKLALESLGVEVTVL